MALYEGCRRLRKSGMYLILTTVVILGLYLLPAFLISELSESSARVLSDLARPIMPFLTLMGWLAFVIGGSLWLGGWIVEGFASPHRQSD